MKKVIFKNEGTIGDTASLILWFEVIRQADLMENLDHAVVGCSKDRDNKCRCLNNWVVAPIFNRKKLLKLKEKTLDWLREQRNFEPDIKNSFEIKNLKEFFHIASLSEIEDEIKKIEYAAVADEVEEVFDRIAFSKKNEVAIVDAFDDVNAYPCSREVAVDVLIDQSRKMRGTKNLLLDWDCARDNQEVIKKIQEESWKKLLSEKVVLKRGIKPAPIEECKRGN